MKGAAKAGAGAAAVTAVLAVPGMIGELSDISKNEEMTKQEKSTARGGAIGSVVPVVGTAVGALVGGLIGQFGGPVGRFIGEKIGAAVGKETKDKTAAAQAIPAANLPPAIRGYNPYAPGQQAMRFDGTVGLQTDLYIHRDGSFTASQRTRNDSNYPFEAGNAVYARGIN